MKSLFSIITFFYTCEMNELEEFGVYVQSKQN